MDSPFFIVGCGRSGTTLLRNMLNHHSKIAIPLESLFIIDYLSAKDSTPADTMRSLIAREYEIEEWGMEVSPDDLAEAATARDIIIAVHKKYMETHGKVMWGQKTPRFIRHGELLKATFPDCRFIHVIRDPRAVVSSLIQSNVHRSNAYYASLRWLNDVGEGLRLKDRYGEDLLEIRYEDLVGNPKESLKAVCAFIGVDFEPSILEYHKKGDREYSAYYKKVHSMLGKSPTTGRIDAWRTSLSKREISLVESLCGETMKELGYEPSEKRRSRNGIYILFLRLQRIFGFMGQLYHYALTRRQYIFCNLRRKLKLSLPFGDILKINY